MPSDDGHPRSLFDRTQRRLSRSAASDLLTLLPARVSISGPRLLGDIRALADALSGAGVGAGSRVLVAASHPLVLPLAVPALWSLGAIPILGDGGGPPAFRNSRAGGLGADWSLGEEQSASHDATRVLAPPLPLLHLVRPAETERPALPRGTVLVRTTSGSAGRPRGIALSASQTLADMRNILSSLRLPAGTRGLGAVPLGHAYGFSTLLSPLLFRSRPLVLLEQPLPQLFRSALGRYPALFFPGVPFLFELLAESGLPRALLHRLVCCLSAGAPLPAAVAGRFSAASGRPVRNFYGASECGAVACDRSRSGSAPPGCAGTPLRGVRVCLNRRGVGWTDRGPDGIGRGRIGVAGKAVALGYVRPSGSPQLFRGRFWTGDLGRIDRRKRLFVDGRLDAMVNVGGLKVWPAAVERVLGQAPGVESAAVVGLPDSLRGQVVAAAVVGRPGLEPTEVLRFCRSHLRPHELPRRLMVLRKIPQNQRGKVDREQLKSLLGRAGSDAGAR